MNPLVKISTILFDSLNKNYDKELLNKALDLSHILINEDWPMGIEDPEININAFSNALRILSRGKLRIEKEDIDLNNFNSLKSRSLSEKDSKDFKPSLLIKDSYPFRYYFFVDITKKIISLSSNNYPLIKNYSYREVMDKFMVSNENINYLKSWYYKIK